MAVLIPGGETAGAAQRRLAFAVQPSGATEDEIITPAVQVAAQDSVGNVELTFTGTVTIRLGTNPTGAFLRGTLSVAAVNGVASFGDLTVDRPGTGFTLVASASNAQSGTSAGFNIVTSP